MMDGPSAPRADPGGEARMAIGQFQGESVQVDDREHRRQADAGARGPVCIAAAMIPAQYPLAFGGRYARAVVADLDGYPVRFFLRRQDHETLLGGELDRIVDEVADRF